MIPRFKPDLDIRELIAAFSFSKKDDVKTFEEEFAKKMGQKYAIAFPYGRTGLMILLKAMGLKDKEIICPAYTCVVVPHAIVFSGNIPVFVDCKENEFNMDLDLAASYINEKTGAIIPTSLFGYPVDLDKLDYIRSRHPNIKVIQDCAHSFSAEWKGRPVHKEGDAAIFSLNISKLINSIFGGIVTTDNDELAQKIKELRSQILKPASLMKSFRRLLYLIAVYFAFWEPLYGFVNKLERMGMLDRFVKYYDENSIDMPEDFLEMMCNVEARVGLVQIKKYDQIVAKHRERAARWYEYLKNEKNIVLPPKVEGATYSHFVCLVDNRKEWLDKWRKKGVQLGQLIEYCIPYMKAYQKYKNGEYPVALRYSKTTINFPLGGDYV